MKNILLLMLIACTTSIVTAQTDAYQLSTHILDISEGLPAAGVTIKLEKKNMPKDTWEFVSEKTTMENGRVNDFLPKKNHNNGIYRFTFFVKDYYNSLEKETFYPFIEVVFEIIDDKHYHVPITLSAYGYSTYRGS
ncbi:hydroxyisourate hydrolase [Nonlabens antarcticus]|uniref:hydroxyisourate hydrolase n=1 Tax=Nonlabens antarcticus TaxID=392714 RepID=UPI0018917A43|nr:hydroxyisourate hydrolase [Nonlabens antarcticus]